MFRQRPAAQANFYAITGITASFPVFSQPVIRVGWGWGGEMEGVRVKERAQVCVFVCGGLRVSKEPSRYLLWSGDEELGVDGGLECV